MDEEALAQRKEYDNVINERDILGTQLIRRNDELALLYEKLRIQQSALKKGEVQYAARMDDIRLLRIKLQDVVRESGLNNGSGPQIEEYKRDVLQLQRELLQEKTKVTALSEELENPMNVHRWRKLEGSDPATFELIQKIQTLQRRLIAKTEEVVEKGLVIQEKEKLYVELKNILARQPGPEVAEQLSIYQQNLREKTRQMKAMASELNMCVFPRFLCPSFPSTFIASLAGAPHVPLRILGRAAEVSGRWRGRPRCIFPRESVAASPPPRRGQQVVPWISPQPSRTQGLHRRPGDRPRALGAFGRPSDARRNAGERATHLAIPSRFHRLCPCGASAAASSARRLSSCFAPSCSTISTAKRCSAFHTSWTARLVSESVARRVR